MTTGAGLPAVPAATDDEALMPLARKLNEWFNFGEQQDDVLYVDAARDLLAFLTTSAVPAAAPTDTDGRCTFKAPAHWGVSGCLLPAGHPEMEHEHVKLGAAVPTEDGATVTLSRAKYDRLVDVYRYEATVRVQPASALPAEPADGMELWIVGMRDKAAELGQDAQWSRYANAAVVLDEYYRAALAAGDPR